MAAAPLTRDVAGLAVLLAVSGVTHLVRPEVYEGMVPHALGRRRELVHASGVAELLCAAVGPDALRALRVVVAIGATTTAALDGLGIASVAPPHADFRDAARLVAERRDQRRT